MMRASLTKRVERLEAAAKPGLLPPTFIFSYRDRAGWHVRISQGPKEQTLTFREREPRDLVVRALDAKDLDAANALVWAEQSGAWYRPADEVLAECYARAPEATEKLMAEIAGMEAGGSYA
jgi:hypothetical protein